MFAYDKTFDPKVFLGHCDLISCFSDFAFILTLSIFSYVSKYDKTLDPKVLIDQCELISRLVILPCISALSWCIIILHIQ